MKRNAIMTVYETNEGLTYRALYLQLNNQLVQEYTELNYVNDEVNYELRNVMVVLNTKKVLYENQFVPFKLNRFKKINENLFKRFNIGVKEDIFDTVNLYNINTPVNWIDDYPYVIASIINRSLDNHGNLNKRICIFFSCLRLRETQAVSWYAIDYLGLSVVKDWKNKISMR